MNQLRPHGSRHALEDLRARSRPAGRLALILVAAALALALGACGGAPAVQVNYELIEGLGVNKARDLVRWLRDAAPEMVRGDEMQALFGGQQSFDWGPPEAAGAGGPVPTLDLIGTIGESE